MPENMLRAMAKQAEAERERRAKIIHAEGEFNAAAKLVEAAALMATQPMTLQLRYLQTLTEIGVEKNTTIVFPLPMELINLFNKTAGAINPAASPAVPPTAQPAEDTAMTPSYDDELPGRGYPAPYRPRNRRPRNLARHAHHPRHLLRPGPGLRRLFRLRLHPRPPVRPAHAGHPRRRPAPHLCRPQTRRRKPPPPKPSLRPPPRPHQTAVVSPHSALHRRTRLQSNRQPLAPPTRASASQPATSNLQPATSFMVQVAAVSSQDVADILTSSLEKKGYTVAVHHEPQDKLLHVQIGPFTDKKEAEAMQQRVLADGFNAIVK